MAGRLRTFKPDEQIVQKVCENPDCERQFFVTSRYAQSTRFCSNRCLQHTFYLSRKLRETAAVENELQNIETDNNLNPNDMDAMEKLLGMKDEINELKTKLLLQERDLSELNRVKSDLSKKEQENSDLQSKLEAFKSEFDDAVISNQEMNEANISLEKQVMGLTSDKKELILANLILQSKGVSEYSGARVSYSDVIKYLPEFAGKKDESFKVSVWNWVLVHETGSDRLIIQNSKKQ